MDTHSDTTTPTALPGYAGKTANSEGAPAVPVATTTVPTLAVPAGAAVPKTAPTNLVPCGKKVARIWNTGSQVAAKNPCSKWLVLQHNGRLVNSPPCQ